MGVILSSVLEEERSFGIQQGRSTARPRAERRHLAPHVPDHRPGRVVPGRTHDPTGPPAGDGGEVAIAHELPDRELDREVAIDLPVFRVAVHVVSGRHAVAIEAHEHRGTVPGICRMPPAIGTEPGRDEAPGWTEG
ncbi:MAG: hypothetical protein ACTHN0_01765, partial [Aquihabitans sp.]